MINRTNYISRLERKDHQRQLRQTFFWLLLSGLVIFSLFKWGVPAFINLATFYADWKGGDNPIAIDDTVPPAPPRIILPFDATSSANLDIQGYTEPGATIEFYLNQQAIKTITADSAGGFLITDLELQKGYNWIYAKSIDQAQNVSQESAKQLITFDNQPPELIIEQPKPDSQYYGSGQRRLQVKGEAKDVDKLTINGRSIILEDNGKFTSTYNLEPGEQTLTLIASDQAGNVTKQEIKVTYNP